LDRSEYTTIWQYTTKCQFTLKFWEFFSFFSRKEKFSSQKSSLALVRSRGRAATSSSAAARPSTHLSVHGTAHLMSAASVRPRSVADCLICSAVDITYPRQQGNARAGMSAASGLVRGDIINGLGADEDEGAGNPSLSPRMAIYAFPGSVASTSVQL